MARWLRSCSVNDICWIHTSSSSFAQNRDLRLDLGLHSRLPFVCFGDCVNIWLLPGHFFHERLQEKELLSSEQPQDQYSLDKIIVFSLNVPDVLL